MSPHEALVQIGRPSDTVADYRRESKLRTACRVPLREINQRHKVSESSATTVLQQHHRRIIVAGSPAEGRTFLQSPQGDRSRAERRSAKAQAVPSPRRLILAKSKARRRDARRRAATGGCRATALRAAGPPTSKARRPEPFVDASIDHDAGIASNRRPRRRRRRLRSAGVSPTGKRRTRTTAPPRQRDSRAKAVMRATEPRQRGRVEHGSGKRRRLRVAHEKHGERHRRNGYACQHPYQAGKARRSVAAFARLRRVLRLRFEAGRAGA